MNLGFGILFSVEILIGLLAATGLVLLLIGARGRHVDDHPHCRRCGFDLIGHAAPSAARAPTPPCPECGADVGAPSAVRLGDRRRRPVPATIGATMLALAVFGLIGQVLGGGRFNALKPVWMLRSELAGGSASAAAAARAELARRIRTLGTLTPAQAESIAAVILARQADMSREWDPNDGDLLELAQANGLLQPRTWATYARQAAQFSVRGRSRAIEGEAWTADVVYGNARAGGGTGGADAFSVRSELLEATVAGKPVDLGMSPGEWWHAIFTSGSSWTIVRPTFNLPTGNYALVTRWRLSVGPSSNATVPGRASATLAEWEVSHTTPFSIVPRGTPLVTLVHDESLRAEITQCIRVTPCRLTWQEPEAGQRGTRALLSGTLFFDSPPIDLAFDVFWRISPRAAPGAPALDPVEVPVGTATARRPAAGRMSMGVGLSKELDVQPWMQDVASIDVVLRPSISAALTTVAIERIWDGEIVLENVSVVSAPHPRSPRRAVDEPTQTGTDGGNR